jgi:hypothetical protein
MVGMDGIIEEAAAAAAAVVVVVVVVVVATEDGTSPSLTMKECAAQMR